MGLSRLVGRQQEGVRQLHEQKEADTMISKQWRDVMSNLALLILSVILMDVFNHPS